MATGRGKKTKKSKGKSKIRRFFSLPHWALWLCGGFVVAVYIGILYYFFVGPTAFRWRAFYGDTQYPKGYEIQGIDISHYQGDIDWDELHSATITDKCPIRFVIVKSTEGSSILDENFSHNFNQAREYGFIRGAYHFWSIRTSARSQAQFFLNKVTLESGDLPPVLDVETAKPGQSVSEFQKDILTWLHIVEDYYHVKPILYTNNKFKQKYLNDHRFDNYPYWISHYYVDKMEYKGEWKFWQHTDAGQLPGIKGDVDLNVYNGSSYDLQKLCIP